MFRLLQLVFVLIFIDTLAWFSRNWLKIFISICFVIALAYSACGQQKYLYNFTLPDGRDRLINIDRIRLVYDDGSGSQLILGGPVDIVNIQESRSSVLAGSCGNLVSITEQYRTYSQIKTRPALLNPAFVSQLDSLPDGRAKITFFNPNQSIETQNSYPTVSALLDNCVGGGSSNVFVGDSTISVTVSGDTVYFSVDTTGLGQQYYAGTGISISGDTIYNTSLSDTVLITRDTISEVAYAVQGIFGSYPNYIQRIMPISGGIYIKSDTIVEDLVAISSGARHEFRSGDNAFIGDSSITHDFIGFTDNSTGDTKLYIVGVYEYLAGDSTKGVWLKADSSLISMKDRQIIHDSPLSSFYNSDTLYMALDTGGVWINKPIKLDSLAGDSLQVLTSAGSGRVPYWSSIGSQTTLYTGSDTIQQNTDATYVTDGLKLVFRDADISLGDGGNIAGFMDEDTTFIGIFSDVSPARRLFLLSTGTATPTPSKIIGYPNGTVQIVADQITLDSFPNTRIDTNTVVNFLFTDASGNLLSKNIGAITGVSDTARIDTFSRSNFTVNLSLENDGEPAHQIFFINWDTLSTDDVTGSGKNGRVALWDATKTVYGDTFLVYGSGGRLGVARPTITGGYDLDVGGPIRVDSGHVAVRGSGSLTSSLGGAGIRFFNRVYTDTYNMGMEDDGDFVLIALSDTVPAIRVVDTNSVVIGRHFFLPKRTDSTQPNAPNNEGSIVYNDSKNGIEYSDSTKWYLVSTRDTASLVIGTESGSGASITQDASGNALSGRAVLVTGTGAGTGGSLFQIELPWQLDGLGANYSIVLSPANAAAAAEISKVYALIVDNDTAIVYVGSSALTDSTTYSWYWQIK